MGTHVLEDVRLSFDVFDAKGVRTVTIKCFCDHKTRSRLDRGPRHRADADDCSHLSHWRTRLVCPEQLPLEMKPQTRSAYDDSEVASCQSLILLSHACQGFVFDESGFGPKREDVYLSQSKIRRNFPAKGSLTP
jgi:hypothetical protein